jgi:MoaA/NifB/PqqE/SkfB family radical SAM enzyme
MVGRSAHLGLALLRSTAVRPSAPLKLNLCLTYWCQYKCKTCNIWRRKPTDELTTDEVGALIRENPHVNWVDLTGGEIFLRPDIDDIFDAILTGWSRLAILHFPTNGFQTDRIVQSVERIARHVSGASSHSRHHDRARDDAVHLQPRALPRHVRRLRARVPGP